MFIQKLLPIALLTAPALAQNAVTDFREVVVGAHLESGGLEQQFGFLRSLPNSTMSNATLRWEYGQPTTPLSNLTAMPYSMPMHRIGNFELSTTGQCLVVGHALVPGSSDVGVIALLDLDEQTGGITVLDAQSVGSANLTEVCYDGEGDRLFVLDAAGRSVLAGDWSGSGALPTSWEVVADSTTFPGLARPYATAIQCDDEQSGVRIYQPNTVVYTRFDKSGANWTADSTEWSSNLGRCELRGPSRFLDMDGDWEIEVFGSPNFPISIEVEGENGLSETRQLTGAASSIAPAGFNLPGDPGTMHSPTTGSFDFRTCQRIGEAQNTNFFNFGELSCDVFGPYIGQSDLIVSANVLPHVMDGLQLTSALVGECRIGVATNGGAYPVTEFGSAAVLTPLITLPFNLSAGVMPAQLSFQMPEVPAGTDNLELLFQVVVSDGTEVAFTEVFGVDVRPHAPWVDPDGEFGLGSKVTPKSAEELVANFHAQWTRALVEPTKKSGRLSNRLTQKMTSEAKRHARR